MLKELSKYVVIGIAAGIVAYLITAKESVSITVASNNQKEVITGVVLALTVEIDRQLVTVEEAGDVEQPFNWNTDGARLKDAISDAVKRCAMAFGVGLHLWAQFEGKSEYFLDKQLEKGLEEDDTAVS